MFIKEKELIENLNSSKNVLLIEPNYRRSYVPLGLAKIASYIKSNGGNVTFARSTIPNKINEKFDLICMTSLFTTDIKILYKTILECQQSLFTRNTKIMLGGICASLMHDEIYKKTKIKSFFGCSKKLDEIIPDYSIDWNVKDPWNNYSTVFTSRGCNNNCGYCMVNRLEPDIHIIKNWKNQIVDCNENIKISDNNILITPEKHYTDVFKYLAKIQQGVLFNNGIYSKLINKNNAELLTKIKYVRFGLRVAFDRIEEDGAFQRGCELLLKAGANLKRDSLGYVLFNFNDTPQEAYYRVNECWKYGVHPYGMVYRPLSEKVKGSFVGKHWTSNLKKAFKTWVELYGYNRGDRTFETFTNSEKSKIKLTEEDWEKWNYKR